MQLFNRCRGDYCHNCKTERSVELYTSNDKSINYSFLLNKIEKGDDISNTINNFYGSLSYFMCRECQTVYIIDWTNGYPYPLYNFEVIMDFLNYWY